MKKKFSATLLALSALFACSAAPMNVQSAKAASKVGYAEYVSLENAPVIDGVADDVWQTCSKILTNFSADDDVRGFISIVWNETGLYFLGDIYDLTVNVNDLCNLWVSETYYQTPEDRTTFIYPKVEGSYFLCINPEGENSAYKPDSWENGLSWEVEYQIAATTSSDGYIVEAYVPLTAAETLVEGQSIGFDVSVDDYLEAGAERSSYVNWNGKGWYWENPSELGEVVLVNDYRINGSPIENNDDKNDSSNSSIDSSSAASSGNSTENNSSSENGQNDTPPKQFNWLWIIIPAIGIATIGLGTIVWYFMNKKK